MRIAFLGTGDIALPSFRRLIAEGYKPAVLVTQPDRPVGRHHTLTPPAIKTLALKEGIPVLQPEKVKSVIDELAALDIDLMVVMAYGQILPVRLIELPKVACINLHASLLPRHRGAACIQAAIDAGDAETGITVIHVVKKLDAGDMILAIPTPIGPEETGGQLHDRLAELAPQALMKAVRQLADGTASRTPQNEGLASYIPKLEREDGVLDFDLPATTLERRIRAFDPWPGTSFVVSEDGRARRLKVFPPVEVLPDGPPSGVVEATNETLVIGCAEGALRLMQVQPEGGKRMSAEDYLRGKRPTTFREIVE